MRTDSTLNKNELEQMEGKHLTSVLQGIVGKIDGGQSRAGVVGQGSS